ncbi:MAG: sulfatase-like hydrolase/transferase [Halioglobus sp.]
MIKKFYLLVFCFSVSVSQPMFDVFSRNMEFLSGWDVTWVGAWVVSIAFFLVPPSLLTILLSILFRRSDKLGRFAELFLVSCLAAAFMLQLFKQMGFDGYVLPILFSITIAVLIGFVLTKSEIFQSSTLYLALASAFIPAYFLYTFYEEFHVASNYERQSDIPIKAGHGISNNVPVVVVVYDELPLTTLLNGKGYIDQERFPNIAEFAEDSVWYRNAKTSATSTVLAVPSIISGVLKDKGTLPTHGNYPENLFSILASSHKLNVLESVTSLCPKGIECEKGKTVSRREKIKGFLYDSLLIFSHLTLPNSYSVSLVPISAKIFDFAGLLDDGGVPRLVKHDRFISLIDEYRGELPPLFFMHGLIPHVPWMYFPSGNSYFLVESLAWRTPGISFQSEVWTEQEWPVIQGYQRHVLQTMYVDTMFGEIVSELKASDIYEDSLVIFVSDHGASFWPGESRRGGKHSNDIYSIPLIVKYPNNSMKGVSYDKAGSLDIVPTVFEVLGLPRDSSLEGDSLMAADRLADDNGRFSDNFGNEDSLERKISLFSDGDVNKIFRVGEFGPMIGKELGEVKKDDVLFGGTHIENSYFYNNVVLSSGFIPGFVTGYIDVEYPEESIDLALGLNGKLCSFTKTHRKGSAHLFEFLVQEQCFREGVNRLSILNIVRGNKTVELTLAFTTDDGNPDIIGKVVKEKVFLDHAGELTRTEIKGGVSGFVYDKDIGAYRVTGWAADVVKGKPAKYIAYALDGQLRVGGVVQVARSDVAAAYSKPSLGTAGFDFNVNVEEHEADRLRFFAIDDKHEYVEFRVKFLNEDNQ